MQIAESREVLVQLRSDVSNWIATSERCDLSPFYSRKISQISHKALPSLQDCVGDYDQFCLNYSLFIDEVRNALMFWRHCGDAVLLAFCNLILIKVRQSEHKIDCLIV
ncbi:hypothetical protein COT97_04050 [Candidatus Falkowbacteria bacterium CG10_big_fil_rev_8_21_14_0_10_39_11]|uniref:Uncharacterized protein n=1 Tax=Candidatus Falkowbacteria bacterium CG10_big_fil_rev_8_21_14_0_10_39_11 TaxID=1974565 RepID=A0A2H0V632_9BACT|nr:MAG: hypothetical protein COT97_04050 [Candidatus Falkowbacteria bacterium CG10_big_fil_rev_8_21_14_0_10_39_11]